MSNLFLQVLHKKYNDFDSQKASHVTYIMAWLENISILQILQKLQIFLRVSRLAGLIVRLSQAVQLAVSLVGWPDWLPDSAKQCSRRLL